MEKREAIFLLLVSITLIFFLILLKSESFTGFSIKEFELSKIDPDIKDELKNNEEVEVIVNFKESPESIKESLIEGRKNPWTLVKLNQKEIEELANYENVENIELQREFEIFLEESIDITNAEDSWNLQIQELNLTGKDNTVCVIDTGIDFSHPALQEKDALGCNVYCYDAPCIVTCDETDLHGHGTHVAGIIASSGEVTGIAPESKLIGVKIFPGNSGTGTKTANIRRGLQWCTDNIEEYNISAITLSLGTSGTYTTYCDNSFISLKNVIDEAFAKNVSVTAATGNQGRTNRISSPACISSAIPVSATNKDDTIADYSNFANIVQLVAPGTNIISTCNGGSGSCDRTGTSMSTPMVAAAISMLNQHLDLTGRSLNPHQIENILNITGFKVSAASLTLSRIDILQSQLYLDSIAPTIFISSNQTDMISGNITLICNAEDWQLSQLSMRIWNSSSLYFESNSSVFGTETEYVVDLNNIPAGEYVWNCLGTDARNNSDYSVESQTFNVGGVFVSLLFPTNNSYFNSTVEFSCHAETTPSNFIAEINLEIYKNGDLAFNETYFGTNHSETANYSYVFNEEGEYVWNCNAINDIGEQTYSNENRTIFYDISPPEITLTSPPNSAALTSNPVSFTFNMSDQLISNCSLILNGQSYYNLPTQENNSFSVTLSSGSYNWQVMCTDQIGNSNISEERQFSLSIPSSPGPGSSGGGGGGGGGGGSATGTSNPIQEAPTNNEEDTIPINQEENVPNPANNEESTSPITGRTVQEVIVNMNLGVIIGTIISGILIVSLVMYFHIKKHKKKGLRLLKQQAI